MTKLDADRFLQLLSQSGLVEEPQLDAALEKVKAASGGSVPTDVEELIDRLIDLDIITRWQSESLLKGKYKGFRLGRFKLLGHIGSGGMSSVYLAEHMVMHHKVAIKVLPSSKVEDSSYLARFKREAQTAAKLQHKNIVRAHDIDQEGKTHYIVMDFVEGQNLQNLVKENGPLDYETAADFIAQTAEGLHYAHEAGIVHRDIKPANLLVDANKTVKILDMGLAMFHNDDTPSLTVEHDENVLGTADYLAPEQAINSHLVDRRADIYSLGCTLYYLLCGHPPFPEGTLPQRLMKHQTQVPPSIYEDRQDAPQALVNICLRMMVKSPDGRYQNAAEIVQELSAYLVNPGRVASGVRSVPVATGDPNTKELRTRKAGDSNRPRTRPGPPGAGDTISNRDGETIKGPARPPARKRDAGGVPDFLSIRLDGSDKLKTTEKAKTPSKPGGSDARPNRPARRPNDESGEFVIDTKIFGNPSGSSASNKSLMSERARTKKSDVPVWLWVALAGGAGVVALLVKLLA